MKPVSETLHLLKRGDVYHYFRRVPKHLVLIIGKRFLKRSLGVTDRAEAKKLRTIEDLKADALFAAAEKGSLGGSASKQKEPPISLLIEHLRGMVEQLDKRSAEAFAKEPPVDRDELDEIWKDADQSLSILRNPGDPRRDQWVSHFENRLFAETELGPGTQQVSGQLSDAVRRGLIELTRRKMARLEDRNERLFYDVLFDPKLPSTATLGELTSIYLAEKIEAYGHNNVSQKRTDKIKSAISTLLEMLGSGMPVHTIDDDIVQRVRSFLAQTPKNRLKIYPKLTFQEALEKAAKEGRPTLSPPTQQVYLDVLREVLDVAVRKKFLPANPAIGARPIKKDLVPADQKRRPWSRQQVKDFFEGEFYRSCAPGLAEPYNKPDRAWRFWLPLIMLFSGARPNEIAQLHVKDVQRTTSGTWFLDLADEAGEDGKSLKTISSRRRVPLHPELIRIGFLDFVKVRKSSMAEHGPRLFHELKANKYGNLAWYAARRFNEVFVPGEIELEARQSLYSLRHNVRDALRRIKAPDETLLAVCGWAPNGKAVSSDYGDFTNPDLHIDWVARLAYDDLDLSFLHLPSGA